MQAEWEEAKQLRGEAAKKRKLEIRKKWAARRFEKMECGREEVESFRQIETELGEYLTVLASRHN